jgi:hypothetical protein
MKETRAGAVGWEECVTICVLWNSLVSFPVPRRTRYVAARFKRGRGGELIRIEARLYPSFAVTAAA